MTFVELAKNRQYYCVILT